jgi:hypothetical protein
MSTRTFQLQTPHMTGTDIREFQETVNFRFEAWDIGKRIREDGDYGAKSRRAAKEVCVGLGLEVAAIEHGIEPELRSKFRHPETRTDEERERSGGERAKAFRAKLRKQFASNGEVVIALGANRPDEGITPMTLDYIARMAARINRRIVITTGTNHNKFTVNGNISDHFSGHAVDLGMIANGGSDDSPVGDRIMEAGLVLAGVSPSQAKAQANGGGLFTLVHEGKRIQCIWKTNEGGNHHNHVHIGVRPA